MALTVGTNSYLTVAEASAYLSRRLHAEAWAGVVTTGAPFVPSREVALLHAATLLESLPWAGDKSDPDQALSFPRNGDADAPQAVKDAQAEIALWLLTFDHEALLHLSHAGVTHHATGPVQMDLGRAGGLFHALPPIVQSLLGEYVALGATLTR